MGTSEAVEGEAEAGAEVQQAGEELRRDVGEQQLGQRRADAEAEGGEQAEDGAEPLGCDHHGEVSGAASRWKRV